MELTPSGLEDIRLRTRETCESVGYLPTEQIGVFFFQKNKGKKKREFTGIGHVVLSRGNLS